MKAVVNFERCFRAVHIVPYTAVGAIRITAFPYANLLPVASRYFAKGYLRSRTYHSDFSPSHKVPTLLFIDSLRSSTYLSTRHLGMAYRRSNSTQRDPQREEIKQTGETHHNDAHGKHSHSIFHSHSHDEHDHGHDAEQIVQALQTAGDRGSRITLIGLFANIGLTGAKGLAGWYMHSASLLADAGHSMSDLLGDLVVLFCWKLSRKPPSGRYPYGFAKFETLGTTTVSLLLIGGALGIGFHSYHLLVEALATTVSNVPPGQLHDLLQQVTSVAHNVPAIGHSHGHTSVLDPNAAWFAAVGVVAKEWLYRVTKKVADEEHSPVLYANAIHHRSDAYSSVVALFAIIGSWLFPALPLDPIGGLLVSFVILKQGLDLFGGAFAELTDAGISANSQRKLLRALDPLLSSPSPPSTSSSGNGLHATTELLAVRHLRAKRAGSLIYVDLTADVPSNMSVLATSQLEVKILRTLQEARKEISEVRVKFHPIEDAPRS
ncbi:cation efflux family-domain-containing protein [Suillus paluster]|uniref:cation efflux family-domain-containing protein n=1 Tax=Suillus paluster TaxID=48578 RepID=UPI001B8771FB|nr:cation efflux family-domain-containing protein [Suillus paluster]KAG1734726.1 cation efflux family-domain-containing protein [Suillus paluster]